MTDSGSILLTVLWTLPLAGAAITLLLGTTPRTARVLAVGFAGLEVLLSLLLFGGGGTGQFRFTQRVPWVPAWGVSYRVGVDGISMFLVMLSAVMTLFAILASGSELPRGKQYLALLLTLESATVGSFVALDLVLFYLFWELMLVPVYLLIVGWGGPNRARAGLRFLIYSFVGSLFMLVSIIALGYEAFTLHHQWTFSLVRLVGLPLSPVAAGWLFAGFAIAFAVKAPLWPFHGWLPEAYTEAPLPVAAVLSGVLSKAGVYGFLRFALPLFPVAARHFLPVLGVLAVVGILYGAVLALTQQNMRRILAFSSLSHMGLILLGAFAVTAIAVEGTVLQMVNHGIIIGALFFLVGMMELRTGGSDLHALGGLARRAPVMAGLALGIVLAALGLPGLNGFAGEFLILLGVFQRVPGWGWAAIVAVVLAAAYMIRFFQGAWHGSGEDRGELGGRDLLGRERVVLVPLLLLMVLLGLWPSWLVGRVAPAAQRVTDRVGLVAPRIPGRGVSR